MEETGDSTTDTQRYSEEDRQGIANHYVTLMLHLVRGNPRKPAPEISGRLTRAGSLRNRGQIIGVFRGRPNLHRATVRMDVVRVATVRGEAHSLPITTEVPESERIGCTVTSTDG